MDLGESRDAFLLAAEAIAGMNPKVERILLNGNYIYNCVQDLYWFEHVMERNDCDPECDGHRYWGAVVPYLREFDRMVDKETAPGLHGYRVVRDPMEALTGSWEQGAIHA